MRRVSVPKLVDRRNPCRVLYETDSGRVCIQDRYGYKLYVKPDDIEPVGSDGDDER